jgi:cytoskeletal protein RodZ
MTAAERLADARHRLGLSLEALESQTGFGAELLRSIEEIDLPRLPSGAVLEAAVRAFAAAVQLDAEAISRRYLAGLPILANAAEALTAFEPEAHVDARPSGPRPSGLFAYEPAYEPRPSPPVPPRATSRISIGALLLVSALAVIGGYIVSARAQFWTADWWPRSANRIAANDTRHPRPPDPTVAPAAAPATAPTSPAIAANSTQAATTASLPSKAAAATGAPLESKESPGAKAAEQTTTAADAHAAREAAAPVPSAFIVVPGSGPAATSTPPAEPTAAGELSGSWNVVAHDESTTGEAVTNRVAYYVRLEQRGTQIAGNGYRVSEDGAEAAASQQPVSVRGTLSGERLTLNFSGRNRERFVLYRSDDGVFRGRFRRAGAPAGKSSVVTVSPRESIR